ncbi:NEW3 domain-containing protein [Chloroflexota bacterium]
MMTRFKVVRFFLSFVLLFTMCSILMSSHITLAKETGIINSTLPPIVGQLEFEEALELDSQLPILRGKSGDSFEFEVEMKYMGTVDRVFDLATTVPTGWVASITPGTYGATQEISAIRLKSFSTGLPEKIKVRFVPSARDLPDPGEYMVKVEASSGDIRGSIELKAVVTARYEFLMLTSSGRLNTEATADKDNHLSVVLANTGSAAIENITFSSTKHEGWTITFSPERIEALETGLTQEVDVVIKPLHNTIAGDYEVRLFAESKDYSPDALQLRVTVLTPTIWAWVGILIVLAIVAGVSIIFWRLGRR